MADPAYEHIVLVQYGDVLESCDDPKSTLPSESSNALLPLDAMSDPPLCEKVDLISISALSFDFRTKLSFAPCRDQSNDKSSLPSESSSALWASLEMTGLPTELKSLEGIMIDANAEPGRLSYLFLRSITRDFSQEIGRGGFGVVYLGDLGAGKVAVKKLNISRDFSDKDFVDEIKCLIQTKHNNVVRFLGYCADTHGELAPVNGSYVIAEVQQRCFDEGISKVYTKNIHGTLRCIAPETINYGEITFKSDIYGLGIIIIKLLTGHHNYDFQNWHTTLDMESPQVKSCIEIAQTCVALDQHERPSIVEIMQKLNDIERL
uniref:Uncharacterized protein n=1 Tax=Avena sativa TaxID=4498 RepID=A0ACD5VMX8_AVESA